MRQMLKLLVFGSAFLLTADHLFGAYAQYYMVNGQKPNLQSIAYYPQDDNQPSNMNPPDNGPDVNQKHRMPSDPEITQRVNEVLKTSPALKGSSNVVADVNHGIVTLRGSIKTIEDKTALTMAMKDVNGVRRVHNHLTVTQTSFMTPNEMGAQ